MNIEISLEQRIFFRDWLRAQLRTFQDGDFYLRRGDHFLIREFCRYCAELGIEMDEASVGRYLRDENPVIPTHDRCRKLAQVFNLRPFDVMKAAGLVTDADMDEPPASESADKERGA